jgi:lipopolysaccharide export system ATP-binding protein
MPVLKTENLVKSFRGRRVVNDVSLEIHQGEVVGLLGPNGAGKTTTFYIIVGLASPDSGHVFLDGRNITNLPMFLRARGGISYLPQEPSVFRKLTVEENILAILQTLPLSGKQRRERLDELI